MLTDELKDAVLALPIEERMELVGLLNRSIFSEKYDTQLEIMDRGASVIQDLFGINVKARNRLADVVDARTMFCYNMRQRGMYYRVIGDYLGLDHSTVMYYCGRMSDAFELPKVYQSLIRKYEKFNDSLT